MNIIESIKNNLSKILILGLVIFVLIFFQQCNANKKLKAEIEFNKSEIERSEYNRRVDSSQVVMYKDSAGVYHNEKKAYKLSLDELTNSYDSIFDLYQVNKGRKPEVIVKWKTVVKDSIIYMKTVADGENIKLSDTIDYGKGNSRILSGVIPYTIKNYNKEKDTFSKYDTALNKPVLITESGKFSLEQTMNLQIGFYEDENKDLLFDITTSYPGVKFNNLVGAKVSDYDDLNKHMDETVASPWRLGFTAGYGFYIKDVVAPAPYVGVGVMYTPHFLLKKKKKK